MLTELETLPPYSVMLLPTFSAVIAGGTEVTPYPQPDTLSTFSRLDRRIHKNIGNLE